MPLPREPEVIIETDDRPEPGEWTPARGLAKGAIAALIAGAILGAAWCWLAWNRPDVVVSYRHENVQVSAVMGTAGAMMMFVIAWILFAIVHHFSQMVAGLCPVVVVLVALLIVLAKQITVAATPGVDTLDGVLVAGREWLVPARFFTSNIGVWIGLIAAVLAFREGNSIIDYLRPA